MTPRQWGFAATATAAMLVPALLHGATPIDWVNLSSQSGVEAIPPGPGDVLGTLSLKDRGALGATGRLPETDELSAALLDDADDPSEFEDELPPLDGGYLREGQHGIPGVMLDAYMRAADRLARTTPGCKLDWPLLASIGRIESGHAHGGRVAEDGTTVKPIVGPVLDGRPGVAAIPDTDDGRFDGDRTWDRAVGPMQFIPSTWAGYEADGNGDGQKNPNNIYDATVGAGNYLCAYGADLSDPVQRARSVFRYNHSEEYVRTVLFWADAYAKGVTPLPDVVGSDDDYRPGVNPGNPANNPGQPGTTPPGTTPPGTTLPGTTTPPSQGTSNPPTSTTRPGTTVPLTPTPCPTPTPTETTTPTPTTPTTTPSVPPGCPTPTTTTPPTTPPTTTTTTTTTTTEPPATTSESPATTSSAATTPEPTPEPTTPQATSSERTTPEGTTPAGTTPEGTTADSGTQSGTTSGDPASSAEPSPTTSSMQPS
jgi:hypothetical protein